MVVNNGEMQDGPSSGPPVLGKEAPGVLGRVGWAAGAIGVGREGGQMFFPKQTLWLFIPTEASTGLGGAQAQCFLGVRVVGSPAPHQHRDPVRGSAPAGLFLALSPPPHWGP